MKKIFSFLIATIVLMSCQKKDVSHDLESLEGKKSALEEKMGERKKLDGEIAKLRKQIIELDTTKRRSLRVVSVDTIKKEGFQKFITMQGNVQAGDIVKAAPEMSGRILSIFVKEGDRVRKGQMIAKLDGEGADKQLAELQTSLDLAQTVFERQERLWKQNIGSEIQYLEAKSNKERLEKTIETVNFQKSKTGVYAPISGVVNREFAESGEMAPAGMPILEILNDGKVKIVADLPESYLGLVKKGDQVEISFPALNKNTKGRISLLGRTIDPANRTFKIEVDLRNYQGDLKPNLLAEIKIKQAGKKGVISLPRELVQEEISGDLFVYSLESKEDKIFATKKYVQTGDSNDGTVVINDGLVTGDVIINEGARLVKNGEEIKVKS